MSPVSCWKAALPFLALWSGIQLWLLMRSMPHGAPLMGTIPHAHTLFLGLWLKPPSRVLPACGPTAVPPHTLCEGACSGPCHRVVCVGGCTL